MKTLSVHLFLEISLVKDEIFCYWKMCFKSNSIDLKFVFFLTFAKHIYIWNWKLTWWYVCNEWKPDILIHYFEQKCYNRIDMGNRKKSIITGEFLTFFLYFTQKKFNSYENMFHESKIKRTNENTSIYICILYTFTLRCSAYSM